MLQVVNDSSDSCRTSQASFSAKPFPSRSPASSLASGATGVSTPLLSYVLKAVGFFFASPGPSERNWYPLTLLFVSVVLNLQYTVLKCSPWPLACLLRQFRLVAARESVHVFLKCARRYRRSDSCEELIYYVVVVDL